MEILKKSLEILEIPYDDQLIGKFEKYMDLVLGWNKKVNMTAIVNKEDFQLKHFADSLLAVNFPGFEKAEKIIDVGTGAGFPGIPLALCFSDKEFLLTDSLNKRLKILDEIAHELGLSNVKTFHARAEDLGQNRDYREKYDLCLSRAVAKLPVLLEYCLPFVKKGGYVGAYKAGDIQEELKDAARALKILGGKYQEETLFDPINKELDHKILWFKKEFPTPKAYPRKAGTPGKQPL